MTQLTVISMHTTHSELMPLAVTSVVGVDGDREPGGAVGVRKPVAPSSGQVGVSAAFTCFWNRSNAKFDKYFHVRLLSFQYLVLLSRF